MADRSEISIQTLFRSRLNIRAPGVLCIAIPNAANRGQKALNQARREGAAWGFPDVLCFWEPGRVAAIEFKTAKGKVDARQQDWNERLNRIGVPASIQRDPDEALAWLKMQGAPFLFDADSVCRAVSEDLRAAQLLISRCPTPEDRKHLIVQMGICQALSRDDATLLMSANMLETA